jgi:hypothetical protein
MKENNTIQYFHDQDLGLSYAVDVNFTKEALVNIMHHYSEPFSISIGFAKVHPDDQFNKKIGREVAANDLDKSEMHLSHITVFDKRATFNFKCLEGYNLAFRIHEDSDKPHLISVTPLDYYF